ncbi:MAG: YggU family protein [Chloroflexi bacterium]|jgi:uncharacterized protein (TIGR00251 family)|nr:YggU family protein [Chloroflexota bacterium]
MNELHLQVKVIPNAPRTELVGTLENGVLKIKLKAPPEKGRANKELIKYLHSIFNIDRDQVEIITGQTTRLKYVRLLGVGEEDLKMVLNRLVDLT